MSNPVSQLYERCDAWLWTDDLREMTGQRRVFIVVVRMLVVLSRQLMQGQLNLRAMSLVYTTLLSVVPLLAVSFSVLKGFGVHNQLEPALLNFLAPLGPKGVEVSQNIIGFVENIKVGVLGSIGLAFLLYTVVSLTQKVEESFNFVWQVDRLRNLAQRFSSYLSVILIGPFLMFTALGISATILNTSIVQQLIAIEPFGYLIVGGSKLIPYLLVITAFTFIYVFIPNTRVKFLPALAGGVLAGVLWESSSWVFAHFIATSSKYAAIYSGFAILILLLIWLYLNWLILLVGSQVAFYIQHPQYLTREPVRLQLSSRLQERLVLQLMFMIAENYIEQKAPWTLESMVRYLGLPMQPVHQVVRFLSESGFISETSSEPPAFLPRRDIDAITLAELLKLARSAGENRLLTLHTMPHQASIDQAMDMIEHTIEEQLGGSTLRDLVGKDDVVNASQ